jgi:hypothetical protein
MEPKEFVRAIKQRVIENDNNTYRDLLINAEGAKDPIWNGMLSIYKKLSPQEKEKFIQFMRLIQVNTVSHIFGIIDGSTYLSEENDGMVLSTEDGETISGDLQDLFLEMEEES